MFAQLDAPVIVLISAGAIGLVTLMLLIQASSAGRERAMQRRLSRVHERATRKTDAVEQLARLRRQQQGSVAGLETIAARLMPRPALLRERLSRTGYAISLGQYFLVCVVIGLGFMIGRSFVLHMPLSMSILSGVAVGAGLPHIAIGFLINRRRKRFITEFPDAIDLIIRGLRSGLPVPESIRSVGQEFEGPVGVEFRTIADRLRFGQTLDEAMHDAARRLDLPEFNFFVISLSVQRETGGNLAETLDNLVDILRKRRQMQLKIKAMSSEAKASAIILGSLPFLMFGIMYALNRGYVSQLFLDPRGLVAVALGLTCLLAGFAVMMKMVRFEI